tara:strand:- start:80138 stop:81400 length:1263 start_codon:yes stop_codon:yes gene_type:complete
VVAPSEKQRVVVTGMGVLTSVGIGIDKYWNSILAGKSGITDVSRFDASEGYSCKVASEVRDFVPEDFIDPKEVKRNDRYTQFAVAGSKLAVEDAKLDVESLDKERFGVIMASGIGGMETIEKQSHTLFEKGPRRVSPFMIPSLISNIAAGVVAIEWGAKGPNYGIVSACASGTHAIGEAFNALRSGKADIMMAGGSEAAITRLGFAGFCSMKAMSTQSNDEPQKASRPFDSKRDGFVMGEGAGVLILETLEHAQARGAKIYCELVGYAATCDAYHITSPDTEGSGLALCLKNVLEDADLKPEDVDYINAHGTSTPYNDKFETIAIKKVFGEHAKNGLRVSSTKSMIGHLLGAAGAVETAACAKAIETGKIPPTINYEDPDPDCDLNYVPNKMEEKNVRVAINNNLGFGGQNACLALKLFE